MSPPCLPCSAVPHVPTVPGCEGSRAVPAQLFLSSPVPTALFFGSELLLGSQDWGWMSQSLEPPGSLAPAAPHPSALHADTPPRGAGRRKLWPGERHLARLEGRLCSL